jgi:L-fuculose-phosphate aldolase
MKKLDTNLMHPRDQIALIIKKIYQSKLTTTSGGNISIRDDSGDVWITPASIDKGTLKNTDIVCIKKDGSFDGIHKPSSEYPFHMAIYKKRPDIKAIVHAHPPGLVSFSIVRQIPNTNVIPQAKKVCGAVGYTSYALPGSNELGELVANEFSKGVNAIIMENHGTITGGKDIIDAYQRFEMLESCARTIINGHNIGKPSYLADDQIDKFENQIPQMLPDMEAVEYPSDEQDIRRQIQNIILRACEQGLMISSYGTVSARWRNNDFLITPTNVPRWNIQLDDIVQIRGGKKESGKLPSRSIWLHQEIYKRFPKINSIILTQPPYLMAYSITGEKVNVRTIPESWIFLQDITNVPFETHFEGEDLVLNSLSDKTPLVIINNDSVLITGNRLIDTFDRLEVAEFSAKSLVLGKTLGSFYPMTDKQIEELRKTYF